MPADVLKRLDSSHLEPQHLQVVALRISGKRWTEIAADLGITYRTLCRWREDHPEIEEQILHECDDHLESARIALAEALRTGVTSLKRVCEHGEDRDVVNAAEKLLTIATKKAELIGAAAASAGVRDRAANERAGPTGQPTRARVSANVIDVDAELEAELSA